MLIMAAIERLISEIRDVINKPRKQQLLLKDDRFWNQLCSSLDVIQDTDIALDDYMENDFPKSEGQKYLVVYGALQSLVVQQDAVDHLVESLGLSVTSASEQLKDVRDIRIKSVGHPTKKGWRKEEKSYHFISRATMRKDGFQLMSCSPGKDFEFTDVNTLELISRQRSVIEEILKTVLDELKREEEEHKEKFKGEKLADLFSSPLSYYISKVYEVIHGGGKALGPFGMVNLESIEKTLKSFRQALERRDLWEASEAIRYIYKDLEYPISELKKYFQGEDDSESADKKANVNVFFLDKKIEELKEIAKDVDEEYDENASEKIKG